jgi:hypothetical protein
MASFLEDSNVLFSSNSHNTQSSNRMPVDNEVVGMWKEALVTAFEVLSQQFPGD